MLDINRIPHSLEFMTEGGRVALSYIDQRKLPDELGNKSSMPYRHLPFEALLQLELRAQRLLHSS